ncbi:MAG TPA: histidine phosphatase family protein [Steroidobacteraceae bacterium]
MHAKIRGLFVESSHWPACIWLVRHGESAGNVARDKAHAAGLPRIDIQTRDVDVELSKRGREQARAIGAWFADLDTKERPDSLLCSPYVRARETALYIQACAEGKESLPLVTDERFREKEFGILDRLTRQGIEQFYPEQAEIRRHVGKFYHRPPGGESWCDVILRLRSALDTLSLHYAGRRVLVVTHQVVILCFRYLIEELDEAALLLIDSQGDIANCAITSYRLGEGPGAKLELERYNWVVPLRESGASVTAQPDPSSAAR